MSATNSQLVFVGHSGGRAHGCGCGCNGGSSVVFRSVWDRLCRQLFEAMPPEMDPKEQLPDIDVWRDGVSLVDDDSYPLVFAVASDGIAVPKKDDIIEYKGKFFVIGEVEE